MKCGTKVWKWARPVSHSVSKPSICIWKLLRRKNPATVAMAVCVSGKCDRTPSVCSACLGRCLGRATHQVFMSSSIGTESGVSHVLLFTLLPPHFHTCSSHNAAEYSLWNALSQRAPYKQLGLRFSHCSHTRWTVPLCSLGGNTEKAAMNLIPTVSSCHLGLDMGMCSRRSVKGWSDQDPI